MINILQHFIRFNFKKPWKNIYEISYIEKYVINFKIFAFFYLCIVLKNSYPKDKAYFV